MKYLVIVSTLVAGAFAPVFADERGQSIMFVDKADDKGYLTQAPNTPDSKADDCMALSRDIEKLKGKPQRRHAMLERYNAECAVK